MGFRIAKFNALLKEIDELYPEPAKTTHKYQEDRNVDTSCQLLVEPVQRQPRASLNPENLILDPLNRHQLPVEAVV